MPLPKLTKAALKAPPPVAPGSETRPDRRVTALNQAILACDTREEYAREIGVLWKRAQDSFIAIGRYLDQAKAKLQHGEYDRMIENDLPFNRQTAHAIRVAAAAVTSGRIQIERVPPNYTIIYHLATLDDASLQVAERQGLIRPDLRRSELLTFKRNRGAVNDDAERALQAHLVRLLRQREKLDKEIEGTRARLVSKSHVVIDGVAEHADAVTNQS